MKFSVILPLYNKAPYVAKAIDSILAQTFTDYELVIVDDGSKDDSYEVASKAIEGHCRNCHLIRQENAGVSMARNNGVTASIGDYLCFLDADDWWDPGFLEEMSQLINTFPDAGIYGTNYTIVNETKRKTRVAQIGVEKGFEKGYINYCQVYAKTMYMPLWTGAVCIPRSVFEEMRGFPKGVKLGEDFILWVRIALKYKVAFLNKTLAYYNQGVDVGGRRIIRKHKPEEHMLWNLGVLEEKEYANPDYKQLIDNLRVSGLMQYYLSKDYHQAAERELEKIDWERQPEKVKSQYRQPLFWLKLKNRLMRLGSIVKQKMIHSQPLSVERT